VSEPELASRTVAATGVSLADCSADIVEIAALRTATPALREAVRTRLAAVLPAHGRVSRDADRLTLSVRPERWLLLAPPAAAGVFAKLCAEACGGSGAAVELSCALTALYVAGPAVRATLKRGCRLDLDPQHFGAGRAAATFMAQVPVTLAALPAGVLLLTPSTTGRHFREWLAGVAAPFGLTRRSNVTVAHLCGESMT
jgi:heterotetrameric sarcosine oxidase gamma subunit